MQITFSILPSCVCVCVCVCVCCVSLASNKKKRRLNRRHWSVESNDVVNRSTPIFPLHLLNSASLVQLLFVYAIPPHYAPRRHFLSDSPYHNGAASQIISPFSALTARFIILGKFTKNSHVSPR